MKLLLASGEEKLCRVGRWTTTSAEDMMFVRHAAHPRQRHFEQPGMAEWADEGEMRFAERLQVERSADSLAAHNHRSTRSALYTVGLFVFI